MRCKSVFDDDNLQKSIRNFFVFKNSPFFVENNCNVFKNHCKCVIMMMGWCHPIWLNHSKTAYNLLIYISPTELCDDRHEITFRNHDCSKAFFIFANHLIEWTNPFGERIINKMQENEYILYKTKQNTKKNR